MASKKQRPPNAPGANGLRGGRNVYSLKTLAGNWVEESGGPEYCNRGFSTSDFATEAQHQQMGIVRSNRDAFGAALPREIAKDRTSGDMFNPSNGPQSDSWKTNTQVMFDSVKKSMENDRYRKLENSEEVEKYRRTWTIDTVTSRNMRFETESRRAANMGVKPEFVVSTVRFLPGTPIACEKLRRKLVEKYGIFAIAALRSAMNKAEAIPVADFPKFVKSLGVVLSDIEILQLSRYLEKYGEISCEKLRTLLMGNIDYSEADTISSDLFIKLAGDDECFDLDTFKFYIDKTKYPEVVEGITAFCTVYCVIDGPSKLLNFENFQLMQREMYNSFSSAYVSVVQERKSTVPEW